MDRRAWVSALIATGSVGLASVLVFHPVMRATVSPSTAVLATTWAVIIAHVHVGSVFLDGMKSIIGALVGSSLGLVAYILADLMGGGHVVATLLVIPFAFCICLADPVIKSPLSHWIRTDAAFLSLYIVASFSKSRGPKACLDSMIAFSFGSLSAILIAGIARFLSISDFGTTKRELNESIWQLCSAQTHWLEGLCAFMTWPLGDHVTELDLRQEMASAHLGVFQQTLSQARLQDPFAVLKHSESASELALTAIVMHSQLLAFRTTISQGSYREDSLESTFVPVSDLFHTLRMHVVLALRPNTPANIRAKSTKALRDQSRHLYRSLTQNAAVCAANRSTDLPQGSEVVRMHCAIISLIRFSLLVEGFLKMLEPATCFHGPFVSMKLFFHRIIKDVFSIATWKKDTLNIKYALRSVIAQQLGAQIALSIARISPTDFGPYILWAQLPIVFCFLPTFGGTLIKGSRRILGTLAAGALGCLTAISNAGSPSCFWIEMIIVTFAGKIFSFHPSVGYAGSVFAFTWYILMLVSVTESDQSLLLTAVFYRMVLTVGGVTASYIFGALILPSFSASNLRKLVADAVSACAILVASGVRDVLSGEPFHEEDQSDECTGVESFKGAADSALRSLHKYVSPLAQLFNEARAEMSFMGNFACASKINTSIKSLVHSEDVLYKFIDSVCVFSSSAATTRTTKLAHSLFFTEHLEHALRLLADKALTAGTQLTKKVHALNDSFDECYLGDRLDDVDRNLMAVRTILGASKKLPSAVNGGSPLLYVFHFALCELADRWDDLVRVLDGKAESFAKMPQRFRRISSCSLSGLSFLK